LTVATDDPRLHVILDTPDGRPRFRWSTYDGKELLLRPLTLTTAEVPVFMFVTRSAIDHARDGLRGLRRARPPRQRSLAKVRMTSASVTMMRGGPSAL
jgi:hypothetical protein